MSHSWINNDEALSALIDEVVAEPRYALDTEFHGERTYHPRLALIQIGWPNGLALIDPFAVEVKQLARLLRGPGTLVAHACDQDLEILNRMCGTLPTKLFDTQIAAGFMGLGTPSLLATTEKLLKVTIAKGDRLTDWTKRPLSGPQRDYAAADVEHLLGITDLISAELENRGRLEWAIDECEARRLRQRGKSDVSQAWWRIKGSRQFRGKTRGVAQEVCAWRERCAEASDIPPRFVLPDLALMGIIQKPPHAKEDLEAIRGIDARHSRDAMLEEILAAVRRGLELEGDELRLPESEDTDRTLGPAVSVISAWLNQRAHELDIESQLLATRSDLVTLINSGGGRLATGWRNEMVGEPIKALMHGQAVLRLAGGGRKIALEH